MLEDELKALIDEILSERLRQRYLPGSEWDSKNSPGEWNALISHYVNREAKRNGNVPSRDDYRSSLIKAAAVILAALEHVDTMAGRNQLI